MHLRRKMKIRDNNNELIECQRCGSTEVRVCENGPHMEFLCKQPTCAKHIKWADTNERRQVEQIMADNAAKIQSYPLDEKPEMPIMKMAGQEITLLQDILQELKEINASCKRLVGMH